MIFDIELETLVRFIEGITSWLPDGRLSPTDPFRLPWGIDGVLVHGVAGYKMLMVYFPPFQVVFDAFLIYIGFKVALRLLRMVPLLGRVFD